MTRIHILGASGAGTSTLGAAVAAAMAVPHLDADSYYWQPTDPPFTSPHRREVRLALLMQAMADKADWVLSGSALGWAQPLERLYELIVYVRLDPVIRMARLREREHRRYGQRIESGGDMNAASVEFLAWAAALRHRGTGTAQPCRARGLACETKRPDPAPRHVAPGGRARA